MKRDKALDEGSHGMCIFPSTKQARGRAKARAATGVSPAWAVVRLAAWAAVRLVAAAAWVVLAAWAQVRRVAILPASGKHPVVSAR